MEVREILRKILNNCHIAMLASVARARAALKDKKSSCQRKDLLNLKGKAHKYQLSVRLEVLLEV